MTHLYSAIWPMLALLCLLRADSTSPPMAFRLVYIGSATPQTDRSYSRWSEAVARRQPRLWSAARMEYLSAKAGDAGANREAVSEAVRRKAALIVAPNGEVAQVSAQARIPVPVVFGSWVDPVRSGVVASMRRPGGNMTGVSLADRLHAKRFELLREAFPGVRRVAVLVDRWTLEGDDMQIQTKLAAEFGLVLTYRFADDVPSLAAAMRDAEAFDAWYVPPTYVAYVAVREILANLRRAARPSIWGTSDDVRQGAALAYAQDNAFVWDTWADMAARILLDGEPAGDIPVERPRRFLLVVRAVADVGMPGLAATVLRRADLVF